MTRVVKRVVRRVATRLRQGLLVLLVLGCGEPLEEPPAPPGATRRLSVLVTNEPLRYLAERIGGDAVEVRFPAPPGVDPAAWGPDAETVAAFQEADLVLLNGAGHEPWLARVSLPAKRLVDTSAGFADRLIPIERDRVHQHGPEGEHSHRGTAFTTWLDPELAAQQARAVAAAFAVARPAHAAAFAERLAGVERDLAALDVRLARAAERLTGVPVIFSHPVYAYLERRYDLDGRSLHWEPDEAPGEQAWAELDEVLGRHPAALLVWEGAPLPETVAALEERGIQSILFATGANRAGSGETWLGVMNANAERLETARPSG